MKIILLIFTLTFFVFINKCFTQNYKTTHSDTIDVLHYTINLDVDYTIAGISGNTFLTITPKINNLDVISLDLLELTVDSIFIDNQPATNYTYNDTLLNIYTDSIYNITDTFVVSICYHGQPVEDPSGFGGFSFSGTYAYSIGVAFIDNPHNYGRVWYPCIDDFVDRATYDFYITADSLKFAVCNGTFQDVVYPGNAKATYHWNMRDEIPTYLANVAVSDYVAVRDTFIGILDVIPIAIYVRPADSLKAVNSFINIKQILEGFEYRYGPYRWERVGLVAVPLGGGMEHATNISYGYYLITGDLTYEWLYAHEISHHWFGDLITCREAEEMWINEGWAVYSEAIFTEYLYGYEAYKEYVRDNHHYVIRAAHIEDGGYRALVGVPHEYTYGTTVYDKGGDVAHTIRGYMGDCTFFPAIKHLMDTFQFSDVTSEQMKNVFSDYAGFDMTDFFNAWVYAPGFPHFSVDSFDVVFNGTDYDVTVFMRQKLKGATVFANSNRVEITFLDQNWNKLLRLMEFSGEFGQQTFTIPFSPSSVLVDLNEKLSDAITDHADTIRITGLNSMDKNRTYFSLDVQAISDSAYVRVEHNWVPPDTLKTPHHGLFLSDYRYWKIDGIFPQGFLTKGKFTYSKSTSVSSYLGYLDNNLITSTNMDSLIILFRPNTSEDWRAVSFNRTGSVVSGEIIVDTLLPGEYTLAFYNYNLYYSVDENNAEKNSDFSVFPNPSNDYFTIQFDINNVSSIDIYSITGEKVFHENIFPNQDFILWKPKNLQQGLYICHLITDGNITRYEKIIIQ